MTNHIESGHEDSSATDFVLGEYRKQGGVIFGADDEPYRLKVTPDKMEIIPQDNGALAKTDPAAEIAKIETWIQEYGIQAQFIQRWLRDSLGLPTDLPDGQKDQELKPKL